MDISIMMRFLQKNFYHHQSLMSFADFLRLQAKFSDAFQFVERCLFAFEYAFINDSFLVVPMNNTQESQDKDGHHFAP